MLLLFANTFIIFSLINIGVRGFTFGTSSYFYKTLSRSGCWTLTNTCSKKQCSKRAFTGAIGRSVGKYAAIPSRNLSESTSAEPTQERNVAVIISPSGGIGEITATTLAKEGCRVRWFVVDDNSNKKLYLPKETWDAINERSGELDIAGGDASSILLPESNSFSLAGNVRQWSDDLGRDSKIRAIVSCVDVGEIEGMDDALEEDDATKVIQNAVKSVTKIACSKLPPSVRRIEINSVPVIAEESQRQQANPTSTVANWISKTPIGSAFGGDGEIPSLRQALMTSSAPSDENVNLLTIRFGSLFGSPESDTDATPFVGGPRRDPIIRDQYLYRSVQLSKTKRLKESDLIRTSRLSIADAVTQLILSSSEEGIPKDMTLSSLRGLDSLTSEDWKKEFQRLRAATTTDGSVSYFGNKEEQIIFEADFASVPSVPKLADWLTLKWAPAVLGSYDIAGIRVGARPVYALRTTTATQKEQNEESLEIVWQELKNFEDTVSVGKMIIRVSGKGIVATRKLLPDGASSSKLSGTKPFPGEVVLVNRLADAAGQATDKGLAVKRKLEKPKPSEVTLPTPMTISKTATVPPPPLDFSGPKSAGSKRSTQRSRGKRSADNSTPKED